MIPGQRMTLGVPPVSQNGTAPRCGHLDDLAPVKPQSADCPDCRNRPGHPAGLVVCLTCGWVACSDGSPNRHARAHYEETDHPIVAELAPGATRRWCYVHQRLV
jgi:uncharacterized UBP type Zn finger protein